MGHVPHALVQDGLPHIMETILKKGVEDPQVLFLAIGDHTCDEAPLQVGQFESSDELLDRWLTDVYLEGHGGGNDGESYMLAWYFARDLEQEVPIEGTYYEGDIDLLLGAGLPLPIDGDEKREAGLNVEWRLGRWVGFAQYVEQDIAGLKRDGLELETAYHIPLPGLFAAWEKPKVPEGIVEARRRSHELSHTFGVKNGGPRWSTYPRPIRPLSSVELWPHERPSARGGGCEASGHGGGCEGASRSQGGRCAPPSHLRRHLAVVGKRPRPLGRPRTREG